MSDIQQVFKSRAKAYRYLQAENIPVGQTKFYNDCDRLNLVQPDKTILLANLMAYVKNELQIGPDGAGRAMAREDRQDRLDALDEREKELKVDKLEREKRNDDRRWMLREDSEAHEAALVGLLRDALRHRVHLKGSDLLRAGGGDPAREGEFAQRLQGVIDGAFNEVADGKEFEVEFEQDETEEQEAC